MDTLNEEMFQNESKESLNVGIGSGLAVALMVATKVLVVILFKEVYLNNVDAGREYVLDISLSLDKIIAFTLYLCLLLFHGSQVNSEMHKLNKKETSKAQSRLFTTIKL